MAGQRSGMLPFWHGLAAGQQHQKRAARRIAQQALDEFQRFIVEPVQVLPDQDRRLAFAKLANDCAHRSKHALPALHGIEVLPQGVVARDVEQAPQDGDLVRCQPRVVGSACLQPAPQGVGVFGFSDSEILAKQQDDRRIGRVAAVRNGRDLEDAEALRGFGARGFVAQA